MKHTISALLYLIVLLCYLHFGKGYEIVALFSAWQVGFWKDLFTGQDTKRNW